jgi:transposase-like protein
MDWVKQILPTIGTLLGGPLGGAAVSAVAGALGISEPTQEKITKALSSGQLTAEQMAALQAADFQLKTRMAELGIEAEKLSQADRSSARQMQEHTGSWVPAALAVAVTVGYFGILLGLMTGDLKLWDNSAMTLLLGALTTAWGSIVAFYYGASHSPPVSNDKKLP